MNRKAAIGLSLNVLVIIIISLVILAGGITLLYRFIGGAEEIKSQLDARTEAELERLLVDQGKQVALPLHEATVYRGESHVFGIGILNIGEEDQFTLSVIPSKVIDEQGKDITGQAGDVSGWLLYNDELIPLQEGEHYKEIISVSVPEDAVKGKYIFTAEINTADGERYGNRQKFYVNVR